MNILKEISKAIQVGNVDEVKKLVNKGIEKGISPRELLNEGLLKGMMILGEKFKKKEVFVPEVLIAARAMNSGVEILKPKLIETGVENIGKVIIGTVEGDLHDIGKNLVIMMMEGNGFEVIDLGIDISPKEFINAVKEHKPNVLAISALLTTTMPIMKDVIKKLEEENLREDLVVMIGGAPVTKEYCHDIKADLYAKDAATAASLAKEEIS